MFCACNQRLIYIYIYYIVCRSLRTRVYIVYTYVYLPAQPNRGNVATPAARQSGNSLHIIGILFAVVLLLAYWHIQTITAHWLEGRGCVCFCLTCCFCSCCCCCCAGGRRTHHHHTHGHRLVLLILLREITLSLHMPAQGWPTEIVLIVLIVVILCEA